MPSTKLRMYQNMISFYQLLFSQLTPSKKKKKTFDTKENIAVDFQLDHSLPCSSNRCFSNLVSVSLDIINTILSSGIFSLPYIKYIMYRET